MDFRLPPDHFSVPSDYGAVEKNSSLDFFIESSSDNHDTIFLSNRLQSWKRAHGDGIVFSGNQCSGRQIMFASFSAASLACLTARKIVSFAEVAMGLVCTAAARTIFLDVRRSSGLRLSVS